MKSMAIDQTYTTPADDKKLIDCFVEDCRLRGMTDESIRRYRSCIQIFNDFIDEKSLLHIDREVLKEFLQYLRTERKVSQVTLKNYFSSLSSLYEYLVYEDMINLNPVLSIRKRYLRTYKKEDGNGNTRKLISVEEMAMLINSILDVRDKAIVTLLAKTGIRRGELIRIDMDDINWEEESIMLKPTSKRSNRLVFFDDEGVRILRRWMILRGKLEINDGCRALFVGGQGDRLNRNGIYIAVTKWAERIELHNPSSPRMEDHFSPHCCRHWFTTHLRRAGMPREFIKELRGDKRRDAIDIYDHIDKEELRKAYLAYIPQLGI